MNTSYQIGGSCMYIKICGLTKLDQAQAIAQMGVNAIGFICVPATLRYISASAIGQITTNLIGAKSEISDLDLIGVFVNASIKEICETVEIAGLNAVQLHGDESPEFCIELRSHLAKIDIKAKVIKAFRIKNQAGLAQAQLFSKVADALLLDAYDPQMAGGTGKILDWQMLRQKDRNQQLNNHTFFISFSTILLTKSSNELSGFQFKSFLASSEFPNNNSTSAGL
jgi:phosphoribosylanthranilate isomerase